uniref:Uncharacterized protein n=1 Tax=Plectus sambesii TaxID=2011161 RepID=A0A914UJF1_9BILA
MGRHNGSNGRVKKRNLRPRRDRAAKEDASVLWEEQQQIERALRASLYEQQRAAATPQISPAIKRPQNSPVAKPVSVTIRESSPKQPEERRRIATKPLKEHKYPSTDDFLRYLCFKDTDFMPKELKHFDHLPLERFMVPKIPEPQEMPVLQRIRQRIIETSKTKDLNQQRIQKSLKKAKRALNKSPTRKIGNSIGPPKLRKMVG